MRRVVRGLLDASVLAAAALAVVPAVREEVHWRWSRLLDRPAGYERFLTDWPAGRHGDAARSHHDDASWRELGATRDAGALEAFARVTPSDTHRSQALAAADRLRFDEARDKRTVRALLAYVDSHPQGAFVEVARKRVQELRVDPAVFQAALRPASAAAMRDFITDFPGHTMLALAEQVARDLAGRNVFELLRERQVQLRLTVDSMQQAKLVMQRSSALPLSARVPAGTLLMPRDARAPTLVLVDEVRLLLDRSGWIEARAATAGLDARATLPARANDYQLKPAPGNTPLTRLAVLLAEQRPAPSVAQAAVWIVVANPGVAGLTAMAAQARIDKPGAAEIAAALRLVGQSGVDTNSRAVWRERRALADQLPPGESRDALLGAN